MDIIVVFIYTQIKWREDTDVLLKPTKENGLKKDSLVRLSKFATIDKDLAIGLIGRVDEDTIKSINLNLIKIFKLDR